QRGPMVEGHPQRVQDLAIQAPGEPAGRPLEGAIEVERDSGRRLRGPSTMRSCRVMAIMVILSCAGQRTSPDLCGPADRPRTSPRMGPVTGKTPRGSDL